MKKLVEGDDDGFVDWVDEVKGGDNGARIALRNRRMRGGATSRGNAFSPLNPSSEVRGGDKKICSHPGSNWGPPRC